MAVMNLKRYKPEKITKYFWRLGTPSYPVYLSLGTNAMIVEGGIGAIAALIIDQINELKIPPEKIKYIALTHTHSDHIGAVPYLKQSWPHIKTVASEIAAKELEDPDTIKEHISMENTRTNILLAKGEIHGPVSLLDNPQINADVIIGEGERIDLGSGIKWTVYATPGHSPCHTSFYEESEGTLAIGDATGFYVPEKDTFWPNYFNSLEEYCGSIRKLHALSARTGVLSHNYIVKNNVNKYLQNALQATATYHREMLRRLEAGEDYEDIAMDKARWVNTLTDEHPFEIMYTLSKVLIKRSKDSGDREDLFLIS